MSVEAISVVDADFARVSAASSRLAAALAEENSSQDSKVGNADQGQAAVQTAEADLEQAQAALNADQAASAVSNVSTSSASSPSSTSSTSSTAPDTSRSVVDPGGIVA